MFLHLQSDFLITNCKDKKKMETKNTMKGSIMELEVGQTATFPIDKMESIRVYASNVGAIFGRKFTTNIHRSERTVTVKRLA